MRIAFGCDHAAITIKDKIVSYLRNRGLDVSDFGCSAPQGCDYTDIAAQVASLVSTGKSDRGILICGTGVGMSIAANKFPGVRAGVCWSDDIARLVSEHNNANILCMPARFSTVDQITRWIDIWLATPFSPEERHRRRVNKITLLEKRSTSGC